ncbi:MAG: DinB family protein [Actinomycetota bacterium]
MTDASNAETSTPVDPVSQPTEYQALLLSFVEGRDVAEAYQALPARIEQVVAGAGDRLRDRPDDGEWSVLEVLGHIVDAELMCAARLRWILAHDEPPLPGYDQELWVARQRYNDGDPALLLSLLRAFNPLNIALWRTTPPEDRARVGIHAERGPESFDLTFRLLAGHGLLHLDQMERTLAMLQARS